MKKVTAIVVSALLLTGCSQYAGQNEQAGTLMGAATGAILGAAIGSKSHCHHYRCRSSTSGNAIVIGALAGGILGNAVGRSMDERDRRAYSRAQYEAMEYNRSGEPSYWHNPDSGHYGSVTPEPAYERTNGEYCREYQQTVTIGGQTEKAYGTACRQPDGSWEIVSN